MNKVNFMVLASSNFLGYLLVCCHFFCTEYTCGCLFLHTYHNFSSKRIRDNVLLKFFSPPITYGSDKLDYLKKKTLKYNDIGLIFYFF